MTYWTLIRTESRMQAVSTMWRSTPSWKLRLRLQQAALLLRPCLCQPSNFERPDGTHKTCAARVKWRSGVDIMPTEGRYIFLKQALQFLQRC